MARAFASLGRSWQKFFHQTRTPRGRPVRRFCLEELESRTLLSPVLSVLPIQAQEGLLFNGPVATFTDSAGAGPIGNYAASINWGDGSATTADTITQNGSTFTVSGSHTYGEEGAPSLHVTVTNTSGDNWTTKASMLTARRDLPAVAAADGLIYVLAGLGNSSVLSTVEAYNPATNSWTPKASISTARLDQAAAAGSEG